MAALEKKRGCKCSMSWSGSSHRALPYCSIRWSNVGADFRSKSFLIQGLTALAHAFLQAHKVMLLKISEKHKVFSSHIWFPNKMQVEQCWAKHKGFTLLWEATEHQVQPSFSQKSFQSLVMDGSTFKWCFYSLVEIKVSYDCQWHTLPDFCLLPEILVHVFLLSLSHF